MKTPVAVLDKPHQLYFDDFGIIHDARKKGYIQIDQSFYALMPGSTPTEYFLDEDKTLPIFIDEKYEKRTFFLKQHNTQEVAPFGILCRSKNTPARLAAPCINFDVNLVEELIGLDNGVNDAIAQTLTIDHDNPHLWKSNSADNQYIKFGDRFFLVKKQEEDLCYTLYKKCEPSLFFCRGQTYSKFTQIVYSPSNRMFYPDTDIGRLQALSGFSYPVAKLHVFCRQIPYDLLTYDEKST